MAAESYPDHAIKIMVPSTPAGGYNVIGRLLADQLSKRLGQNVIVENRPAHWCPSQTRVRCQSAVTGESSAAILGT
jgi:hypothetical protein